VKLDRVEQKWVDIKKGKDAGKKALKLKMFISDGAQGKWADAFADDYLSSLKPGDDINGYVIVPREWEGKTYYNLVKENSKVAEKAASAGKFDELMTEIKIIQGKLDEILSNRR